VNNPSQFGIADIEGKRILKITEKPKAPTSNLAVTGIYLLTPIIFEIIDKLKPSWRDELEITDALDNLLKQNNNISYEKITDYWKDTGTPDDILHANGEIIKNLQGSFEGEKDDTVDMEGNIIVEKGTKIESKIKIIGPVIIGKNCNILKNNNSISQSIIGPNVSVGDNSIITVSSIENSIIMKNCIIDTTAKIKNSIVASNSEIKDSEIHDDRIFMLGEGSKISL